MQGYFGVLVGCLFGYGLAFVVSVFYTGLLYVMLLWVGCRAVFVCFR